MRLAELKTLDGRKIYINPEQVVTVEEVAGGSLITLTNGGGESLKEKPAVVVRLLEDR